MILNSATSQREGWISKNYGSNRGIVRTYYYRMLNVLGWYSAYKRIDWDSVNRVIFVCKGNICRSAYAEAFAHTLGLESISCGLETNSGKSANQKAIEIAELSGINLNLHFTTPIRDLNFLASDLFVAMEQWQLEHLEHYLPTGTSLTLLGLWVSPATPHIEDPYGTSPFYFQRCFERIEKAVTTLEKKIGSK